ncbi:MAG: histidine phosphatase family protein [Rhodospirillum sp.]|nr:histidine phosphatase family protein [Rhodospirillum sp.]MCF8489561.1 histidine phosphatase family protein [Rhodospirillum sp.]MCF8501593.1 histidine phosphatase family protein [Rhodospirillum sp.]
MTDGTPVAFLRHGRTAWNHDGRLQGSTDIPLAEAERVHLETLVPPAPWPTAKLVSSPLVRAHASAEALSAQTSSGGRSPIIRGELREMNWGNWEGLKGEDLARDHPDAYRPLSEWGWDFRPPGGESLREVWDRVAPWLLGLREPTLAVTHIGVMRVVLARAHGWTFQGPPPFQIKRDRLYIVHVSRDGTLVPSKDPLRLETKGKAPVP